LLSTGDLFSFWKEKAGNDFEKFALGFSFGFYYVTGIMKAHNNQGRFKK
jgi:hypothetical protein